MLSPSWAGGPCASVEPCRGGRQPLWCCWQEGKELASRKPRYSEVVAQRLDELRGRWDGLRGAAEEKGRRLFEANRSALYARSYGELESWLGQAEEELRAAEQAKDLTATNLLLKKLMVGGGTASRAAGEGGRALENCPFLWVGVHRLPGSGWQGVQGAGSCPGWDWPVPWGSPAWFCPLAYMALPRQRLEEQVGMWMKELEELGWQGPTPAGDVPDADGHEQRLRRRFLDLLEQLERRRKELETTKAIYQLGRDLEDETVSILAVAGSGTLGAPAGAAWRSAGALARSCGCRSGCLWRGRRSMAPTSRACSAWPRGTR